MRARMSGVLWAVSAILHVEVLASQGTKVRQGRADNLHTSGEEEAA